MDRNLSQHEQQFINKTATSEVSLTESLCMYVNPILNIIYNTNSKSLHIKCIKIPLAESEIIKFVLVNYLWHARNFLPP